MAPVKTLWRVMLLGVLGDALKLPRQANSSAVTTSLSSSSTTNLRLEASSSTSTSSAILLAPALPLTTAASLTITNSANVTNPENSLTSTVSATTNTCCYIRPNAVGINSWYSSTYEIPAATVVTTWVQHGNNTPVPQNSTTVTRANATAPYGWYSWTLGGVITSLAYTTQSNSVTTMTRVIGVETFIYEPATGAERFPGVPNTLLPVNAQMYASSQILSGTEMTYPDQSLTFTSPTPYLWFSQVYIRTSAPCDMLSARYGGAEAPIMRSSTLVMPIPESQYASGFTFEDYMASANMTQEGDGSSLYAFSLPGDFPQWMAKIPQVVETCPGVGSCTNYIGQGEPTVHIPVSMLTAKSDVTITMAATITSDGGGQQTTPAGREPKPAPVVTNDGPAETGAPGEVTDPVETAVLGQTGSPSGPHEPEETGAGQNTQPGAQPIETEDALPEPVPSQPEDIDDDEASNPEPTGPDGLVSVIEDAAGSPAQVVSPAATEAVNIGDIIASVIGLVPNYEQSAGEIEDGNRPVETAAPLTDHGGETAQPTQAQNAVNEQFAEPISSSNAAQLAGAQITVGGSVVTAGPAGALEVGIQTLQPGGPAITAADGKILSLAPSATAIFINGEATPIAAPTAVVTVGRGILTLAQSGNLQIGSQTLRPGSATTLDGTIVSLAPSGIAVIVDGTTVPIATVAAQITLPGSTTLTANAEGVFIIGSETLKPGGTPITSSGTVFSLASNGADIIVNGQTTPIALQITSSPTEPTPPLLLNLSASAGLITAGTRTLPFTNINNGVLVDGSTLNPTGSAIIIDGQTLRLLNPSQIEVVSGSVTRTVDLEATTTVIVTRTRATTGSGVVSGTRASAEQASGRADETETSGAGGKGFEGWGCLVGIGVVAGLFVALA